MMPSPSSGVLPPMLFPPLGRRADWPIRLRHQHTPARICPASFRAPPCAGPVLLTQSLEQVAERETDQGSERHAKNRWLNPLSAPPPSEHQRQPASLVIPGSRWCGQHTLFGLGCVQDRIRATKTAFGLPPPTPSFLLTPDSRYHLGRTSGTMPSRLSSSPTLVPTDGFPWSSFD